MEKKLQTRIRLITVLSIVVIVILTISDIESLIYGLDCLSGLTSAFENELFGRVLCSGNFIFKLVGIIMIVIGVFETINNPINISWKLKSLWIYTALSLILALPLYHAHVGFDGNKSHGHSFWNGGLHFH